MKAAASISPVLLRARDAAAVLAVSVRQVETWAREGRLTRVRVPGVRVVRFSREQVEALARSWCADAGVEAPR